MVITVDLVFSPLDKCTMLDVLFDISVLFDNLLRVSFTMDGHEEMSD